MSNTAETPTIIQPDVSANRATNLRKRLFTWFAEQRLHCIVFIAYVTVTVTVSCFHEPWFDEAQAWLIARDCSWKELLTVRTHLLRTPTSLVDAACHSCQTWHALRNRIEIPQSYVRRADDLAFGIQNETTRITKGNTAIFLFSLLPVWRNFQTICAYDRRNAAHSHQLEQPQHQAMASHTQHDAAMRHELLRIGNRRHACLELDDSISLRANARL